MIREKKAHKHVLNTIKSWLLFPCEEDNISISALVCHITKHNWNKWLPRTRLKLHVPSCPAVNVDLCGKLLHNFRLFKKRAWQALHSSCCASSPPYSAASEEDSLPRSGCSLWRPAVLASPASPSASQSYICIIWAWRIPHTRQP